MNGCGHCVEMKDDWNAAVEECRNNGIGNDRDNFVLGAVESGNTDIFQKHGITTNVSGYPTILYITAEGIKNGNHEKYENPRKKQKFIEWIKEKKNKKIQKGGGKRRTFRRKSKSKKYKKRQTRRKTRRQMKGAGCGCGTSALDSLFGK